MVENGRGFSVHDIHKEWASMAINIDIPLRRQVMETLCRLVEPAASRSITAAAAAMSASSWQVR
jgi:hypothetical protein